MFDILRGGWDPDDSHNPKKPSANKKDDASSGNVNFPKNILNSKKPEDHYEASKKLLSAVKEQGVDSDAKAKALYESTLLVVKTLLEKQENAVSVTSYLNTITELLDGIFNQLVMGDSILNHVYKRAETGYYLPYHISNMVILSLFLGMKLGMNKSKMRELGLAAIFCDMGLNKFKNIVDTPAKLSEEEYALVKTHIDISLEMVNRCEKINGTIKDAIKTHHERVDGSGYPDGLKSDQMSLYAKIIGLVDTYEALSHRRAYREGVNAHRTIKLLLSALKGSFDHEAMKLLINSMSIYPIGTIVELDSGDVARVVGVKPGSPLKPIVMLIQDADGNIITETKIIDLSLGDSPTIINSL